MWLDIGNNGSANASQCYVLRTLPGVCLITAWGLLLPSLITAWGLLLPSLITAWGLLLPTVSNVVSFFPLEQMKSGFGTERDVGCTDFVIVLRFWKAFLSKMCSELLCHGPLQVTSWYCNFRCQTSLQNFVHSSAIMVCLLAARFISLIFSNCVQKVPELRSL
jgi:hypothetical protein